MDEKTFEIFPVLETERLILRQMHEKDAPQVFDFNSNLETLRYVPRDPFTKIEQGLKKTNDLINGFKEKKALWWTFILKTDINNDKLIGYGGLFDINVEATKAELGYGLLQPYWGQGIISEAVKKIVEYGFYEMKLHRIYALIDPANTASIKIVEKQNFIQEGLLKDDAYARNKYFDMLMYALVQKNKE